MYSVSIQPLLISIDKFPRNKLVWVIIIYRPSRDTPPPPNYILFVCLVFFVPLENFSLLWRRHH